MKTSAVLTLGAILLHCSCTSPQAPSATTAELSYTNASIQKTFDTLYNHQQTRIRQGNDSAAVYSGCIEQALARGYDGKDTITQDVLSSMYLNRITGLYDCVTTTVFQFPKGTITATGLFHLVPGDSLAPDHDFPITGGSGIYQHIYGTYTRKYQNGTYRIRLHYLQLP